MFINLLLTLVLLILLPLLLFLKRNETVCKFNLYIIDLIFLNNILSNEHYILEELLPTYNKMLFSIRPVKSFFKPPVNFKGYSKPFSNADLKFLQKQHPLVLVSINESLENIKKYSKHKQPKQPHLKVVV